MPTVSVVIPSYNGEQHLPRLLASLSDQRDVDWEAIVVLDGSTDDSRDVVDRWSERAPVRCISLASNQGRPTALNTGFEAAVGDVLVRCDDDLELPPRFLVNHVRHHDSHPVGVAGMDVDTFADTAYAEAYGRPADHNRRETSYRAPAATAWRYWAANCSVTRETFDRVGPYDESFREYGWEDVDWGYRLHRAGIPIVIPHDVETRHYNPAASALVRSEKAFASGAARRHFESKHPDSGLPGPMQQERGSPWNLTVRATAYWMRARSVSGFAGSVDQMAAHAPTPVARKLISLSVEAAGLAGQLPSSSMCRHMPFR